MRGANAGRLRETEERVSTKFLERKNRPAKKRSFVDVHARKTP